MKKKGFTLVELIAVIVILGIILAIAIPTITGMIRSSSKSSFESNAKLLLKAVDYKKLEIDSFDPTTVNKNTINSLLGLSNENYENLTITLEDNIPVISIIGKNKWEGFIVCGTYHNMKVVESATDCSDDNVYPKLTLNGSNPVNINQGDTYIDAGASATDNIDGDMTSKIVVTSNVNPSVPGSYSVTYSVTDSAGNKTILTRTVNVIDNVAPTIVFGTNGNSTYAKNRSTSVTVTDVGGVNISSLKYLWNTSTTALTESSFASATSFTNGGTITTPAGVTGSYYLWVIAKDNSNNNRIVSSNVFNLDNTAPVITITGNSTITLSKGSSYTDAGATATDNIDTSVTVTSTGTVNTNVVGTYTITYSATDKSGNVAVSKTRTINVVDVSAPVITMLGSNPTTINVGSTYTDAGATAIDDVDGNVTSKITITSTVDPNLPGTYYVTYTVKDNAGNSATLTRTVNVITTEYAYSYTGSQQTFTVPYTGTYKLEVWGAQGGGTAGGLGGYSTGTVSLTSGSIIYIYVGGAGGSDACQNCDFNTANAGYNGGGGEKAKIYTTSSSTISTGGGGGATDIRVGGTTLSNRIIVAGGGGGGGISRTRNENYGDYYYTHAGGAGGGLEGGYGMPGHIAHTFYGGSQTSGGVHVMNGISQPYPGSLGQGGHSNGGGGGGGGGYYGGAGGSTDVGGTTMFYFSGAGGSGYIGGVSNGVMQSGVRAANGYAKITYMGN